MDSQLIMSVLVFLSTLSIVLGILMYLNSRMDHKALLEKIQNEGASSVKDEYEHPAGAQAPSVLARLTLWLGSRFKPKNEEEISHNTLLFLQAGYRSPNALLFFQGAKLLIAAVLPLSLILVQNVFLHMPDAKVALFAVLFAIIGYALPLRWLKMVIKKRKAKIMEGFPDALDLLTVCVEAGMGLDSAINRVAVEMESANKPISDEFKILNMEMRAGRTRRDALRNLAVRTDLEDMISLTTLIIQTDKFGTSIGPALRVHADSMRNKRFQRAEEIASKIPTKLIFPLMLFIFPCLFIVLLAPAVIRAIRMLKGMG